MKRLRLVGVVVQPQFMVDDGDTLTPLNVNPINIAAAEWANVVEIVAEATAQLREQVETDRDVSDNGQAEHADLGEDNKLCPGVPTL